MGGRREEFFVCWAVICTYRKEEKKDYDKNTPKKQRTRKKDEKNVLEIFIFACSLFSCVTFCSLWGFYIYIVFDIHVINQKMRTHTCALFSSTFANLHLTFYYLRIFWGGREISSKVHHESNLVAAAGSGDISPFVILGPLLLPSSTC